MSLTIDKLHESNEFLKFLFDNINSVILLVDDEFKVVTVNDVFSALFHEGEQDIVNRLCGNAMGCKFCTDEQVDCGDSTHCSFCILRQSIQETAQNNRTIIKRKFSHDYYIKDVLVRKHFFITSKRIRYHNQSMILVIIEDNTDLQNQQDKLKLLNEEKNRVLGVVVHDLRNPIGVICGYSDYLLEMIEDIQKDDRMDILQAIKDASLFSLDMLNELLDLSVIESGKLQLNYKNHNYREFVQKVIRINQVLANKKDIYIDFVCDLEEVILCFDNQKIEQVLNNLLSNAIKYSQFDTRIVVTIEKKEENIVTQVKDQGQGIPAADIHSIFYPFKKADVLPTAGEKSTGLGLAIAKRIIEEHHGNISVESVLNEGSTFSFMLPLEMFAGNLSENA